MASGDHQGFLGNCKMTKTYSSKNVRGKREKETKQNLIDYMAFEVKHKKAGLAKLFKDYHWSAIS
jgi:hypothetical protein